MQTKHNMHEEVANDELQPPASKVTMPNQSSDERSSPDSRHVSFSHDCSDIKHDTRKPSAQQSLLLNI